MDKTAPDASELLNLLMDTLFPEELNPSFKELKNNLIKTKSYTLEFVDLYKVGYEGDGKWQLRFRISHSSATTRVFKWTEGFNKGDVAAIESYIKHKAPSIILAHYVDNLHRHHNNNDQNE